MARYLQVNEKKGNILVEKVGGDRFRTKVPQGKTVAIIYDYFPLHLGHVTHVMMGCTIKPFVM